MLESSTSMKPKASNFSDVEMSSLCLSEMEENMYSWVGIFT